MDLEQIKTEQRNQRTYHIDTMETLDMVQLINDEDKKVAVAVEKEIPKIAQAIDAIATQLSGGGRLIYVGCGTSGRLGILDAAECPPTYSTSPDQVMGIIAGGHPAMFRAEEGAEDRPEVGKSDLESIGFSKADIMVGIAASGRTPYVLGAMHHARACGAQVISVTCSTESEMAKLADISIAPEPGPEVVTGSTRMKSGTAQKMVLNMLSTGAMIKLGKVYGNLMVDVKPSNEKLVQRCKRIVSQAADVTPEEAAAALEQCNYHPKVAIVMLRQNIDSEAAQALLARHADRVSAALEEE